MIQTAGQTEHTQDDAWKSDTPVASLTPPTSESCRVNAVSMLRQ